MILSEHRLFLLSGIQEIPKGNKMSMGENEFSIKLQELISDITNAGIRKDIKMEQAFRDLRIYIKYTLLDLEATKRELAEAKNKLSSQDDTTSEE